MIRPAFSTKFAASPAYANAPTITKQSQGRSTHSHGRMCFRSLVGRPALKGRSPVPSPADADAIAHDPAMVTVYSITVYSITVYSIDVNAQNCVSTPSFDS